MSPRSLKYGDFKTGNLEVCLNIITSGEKLFFFKFK